MTQYGMAIDLSKCIGCGSCAIACKTENNTETEKDGRKYNWADFFTNTEGSFSQGNVIFEAIPVLCNHCTDAPCVSGCPVTPSAMYKTDDGITMHNDARCIGCQLCIDNCPYSDKDVNAAGVQYSVVSYNPEGETHSFYDNDDAFISGGTSTPKEVSALTEKRPPYLHSYTHTDYSCVRPSEVTEKCIFCDHRLKNDENPYCVDSCPTGARIFGDINDNQSDVSKAIAIGYTKLKNNKGVMLASGETGTKPNVFYLNKYAITYIDETEISEEPDSLHVYPNPISSSATINIDLKKSGLVSIAIFDITGKRVLDVVNNENKGIGNHKIRFDVSELRSGTYIVRAIIDKTAMSANVIVRK